MNNEESTINIRKIEKQGRNLKNLNTELYKNDLKNKLENLQKMSIQKKCMETI